MRKIPTLFVRDPDDRAHVLPVVTAGCEWVVAGAGTPSRKWDGTCMMLDTRGRWWARREVKAGAETPYNFQTLGFDRETGKTVGWIPVEASPFAALHADAVRAAATVMRPGTYELCGPKVNGNPEGLDRHRLLLHGSAPLAALAHVRYPSEEDAYAQLGAYLTAAGAEGMEGIVWTHPDGRRAKLKARDFAPVPAA